MDKNCCIQTKVYKWYKNDHVMFLHSIYIYIFWLGTTWLFDLKTSFPQDLKNSTLKRLGCKIKFCFDLCLKALRYFFSSAAWLISAVILLRSCSVDCYEIQSVASRRRLVDNGSYWLQKLFPMYNHCGTHLKNIWERYLCRLRWN